jgi:hypothetical protein
LVVFVIGSIPVAPSLPTAVLADGTILTVEAVTASTSPVFEPPTWFSQTWPGRVWQRLHPYIGGLDKTPLQGDRDVVFVTNKESRSFADPALWVWISIYDPKTGQFKNPSPNMRGALIDQRGEDYYNKRWGDINSVETSLGNKSVFGYAWPFFHRPSTQFILRFWQFSANGECAFPIPNPAISDRQMQWASLATATPPAQTIDGLEVRLKTMENDIRLHGYRSFSATTVHRDGVDVSKHYRCETESFIDAWGISSWGYPDTGLPACKVTLSIEENFDKFPPPTEQKLVLLGMKKPADGEVIPIKHKFGPQDNPAKGVALLGRGVYRIQDGVIKKIHVLTNADINQAIDLPSELPALDLLPKQKPDELKSTSEFSVTIPAILLFKESKHGFMWPYRESYLAHGYMLATPVWVNNVIVHPECLAIPKIYSLHFYFKADEPRKLDLPK